MAAPGPRRRPSAIAGLLLAVLVLAGCSGATTELPPGPDLLGRAGPATAAVRSAHFVVAVDPGLPQVTVRGAEGDLTRAGSARGTARLDQLGQLVEIAFVIVGDDLFLKGPTGGFQKLPAGFASTVYDPSVILDPQRGLAALVSTATQPRTEAREDVGGRATYRVAAVLDPAVVGGLVPGLTGPTDGQLWIDAGTSQLLQVRARPAGAPGAVTLTLSNLDGPVTIAAPA